MTETRLRLSRDQVLAFRRRTGQLDQRLPPGAGALRRAAWCGLQDSMPRAALLSLHARVAQAGPGTVQDPSLVQLWGPRHSVFVVPGADRAVFSLGLLPDDARARRQALDLAAALTAATGGKPLPLEEAAAAAGISPAFRIRYAATAGTVLIRWDGARQAAVWTVPPPDADPAAARLELVRRYLHCYGPAAPASFAGWSGISPRYCAAAFAALGPELVPASSPAGDGWLLAADEALARAAPGPAAAARLLPSGDAFFLLQEQADRELLVPDPVRRGALWTPRVWPGALLAGGDIAGTWRRAGTVVTLAPWRRLTGAERDAVAAEAEALPLPAVQPGLARPVLVRWEE